MEVHCKVCLNLFSDNLVPKSLECAHSLCSPCISKLLETDNRCPECRMAMTKPHVSQYPVNFGHVAFLQSAKNTTASTDESLEMNKVFLEVKFKYAIDSLNNKGSSFTKEINLVDKEIEFLAPNLLKEKKYLTEQGKLLNEQIMFLKNGLVQLDSGSKTEAGYLSVVNRRDIMKNLLEEFNTRNLGDVDSNDMKRIPSKKLISLKDFQLESDFILEIYRRIQNFEEIFAIQYFEDGIRVGKIEVGENMIMINSLSKQDDHSNLTTVKFEYLKKCCLKMEWNLFLKINDDKGLTRTMHITRTYHPLVKQMATLCTGETGPSYIGATALIRDGKNPNNRQPICLSLKVSSSLLNEETKRGKLSNRNTYSDEGIEFKNGEMAVVGNIEGGFDIFKSMPVSCAYVTYHNAVGRIIKSSSSYYMLDYYFKGKQYDIVDCGISITIK